MNDNFGEICVVCNTEKSFDNFYNKYRECRQCNFKRVLTLPFDSREKILQQRRDNCARFKDLDNSLKALEEKLSVNNSLTKMIQKTIKIFVDQFYSKDPKK